MGMTRTAMEAKKCGIDGTVKYVIETLRAIDEGLHISTDFMSRADVDDFCRVIGFSEDRLWGSMKTDTEIANVGDAPKLVPEDETKIILRLLKAEIDNPCSVFTPDDGKPFDKTVLDDFLPTEDGGRGHVWEYQFGLKVELEHGRTRGANVTNNHPLLTGIIVLSHLTEDTLYYARLWVMEVEGELFKAQMDGGDTTGIQNELARAKQHLAAREEEKRNAATPANS